MTKTTGMANHIRFWVWSGRLNRPDGDDSRLDYAPFSVSRPDSVTFGMNPSAMALHRGLMRRCVLAAFCDG